MIVLGLMLLVVGAGLVVAEAHVPSGAFGVAGGLMLIAGGIVALSAAGSGAALAVPVGVSLGALAAIWTLFITGKVASTRRLRVRAGAETLSGRLGVVRQWQEPVGQVFVDGALWRARHDHVDEDEDALHEGDEIVVQRVAGLTLCVRRAEKWELI